METTKRTRKKSDTDSPAQKIRLAYREHVLMNGVKPASVYKFCRDIGINEEDFYNNFGSFEAIDRLLWQNFVDETVERLQRDISFSNFTAREKILTFYYALLEVLKVNRSYVVLQLSQQPGVEIVPSFIKGFKSSYESFISNILNEAKAQGEVANRPFFDKRYPKLFWLHMSFLLMFWKDDDSPAFEKTDVVVEKSVNLAFDLIGKGAVDSAIDFAKFMYQNKMK